MASPTKSATGYAIVPCALSAQVIAQEQDSATRIHTLSSAKCAAFNAASRFGDSELYLIYVLIVMIVINLGQSFSGVNRLELTDQ